MLQGPRLSIACVRGELVSCLPWVGWSVYEDKCGHGKGKVEKDIHIHTKVRPWPTVAGKVAAFAFTTPVLVVSGGKGNGSRY